MLKPKRQEEEQQVKQEVREEGLQEEAPATNKEQKTFLKRKSKNPIVMQTKCKWKVESKIDCWVKDRQATAPPK